MPRNRGRIHLLLGFSSSRHYLTRTARSRGPKRAEALTPDAYAHGLALSMRESVTVGALASRQETGPLVHPDGLCASRSSAGAPGSSLRGPHDGVAIPRDQRS